MLVLTRGTGEAICINGEEIKVTILGVFGQQVRIGVEAPKDVPVHREEVHQKIKAERSESAA